MTVTPRTFAQQVKYAQRVNRPVAVYTTATGKAPVDTRKQGVQVLVPVVEQDDPHCFVCHRHTDHFAEHDDMVEAGTARYGEDGSVYPVPWYWDN